MPLKNKKRTFMDSLIRKVVSAKDINHKGQGLWVSMKILMGDLKQVRHLCNNML
jgi:dedicator of cytokinesis protein 1